MRRPVLAFLGIFLLIISAARAQTIRITSPLQPAYCGGAEVRVSFDTTGRFSASNLFRVQITDPTRIESYVDLPGAFGGSPVTVKLPDNLLPGQSYRLRVVADNPAIASPATPEFRVNSPPTAELSAARTSQDFINPFTPVSLPVRLTGGGPYRLTLSDSTRFGDLSDNTTDLIVAPARSGSYTIVRVENACGRGTTSGSAAVSVNRTSFTLQPLSATTFCQGAPLTIAYATETPIAPSAAFSAELVSPTGSIFMLPVTHTANRLSLNLPAGVAAGSGYQIRLRSTEAGVGGTLRDLRIQAPVASVRLSGDQSIAFGQSTFLSLTYRSPMPLSVVLSDGQTFPLVASESGTQAAVTVRPVQTTTFRIRAVTSTVCPDTTGVGSATVTVLPGIRIDSVSSLSLCAGSNLTIRFSSNSAYVPRNLSVRLGTETSGNQAVGGWLSGSSDIVQVDSGRITVKLPADLTARPYFLQVQATDRDLRSPIFNRTALVSAPPTIRFTTGDQALSTPGDAVLPFELQGGRSSEITFSTGDTLRLFFRDNKPGPDVALLDTLTRFVGRTTTFSIASVRNDCGTGRVEGSPVTVSVGNPDERTLLLSRANRTAFCAGERVAMRFGAAGVFDSGNEFRIEVSDRNGAFSGTIIGSGATSPITVTLPTEPGTYRLRLLATAPALRSSEVTVSVRNTPLSATLSALYRIVAGDDWTTGGSNITIAPGRTAFLEINPQGVGPFQVELSDGTPLFLNGAASLPVTPAVTTTYAIRTLRGQCGAATLPPAITINVAPSLLLTGPVPATSFCPGGTVSVPFLLDGATPQGIAYTVQISADNQTFRDLTTTGTASPLTAQLPTDLAEGSYFVRVVGRSGSQTITGVSRPFNDQRDNRLRIIGRPSLQLTGPNSQTTVEIEPFGSAQLQIRTQNQASVYNYVLTDNTLRFGSGTTQTLSVSPDTTTTYTVRSTYNTCGFGAGQGSVTVVVRPGFRELGWEQAAYCAGQSGRLRYRAAGSFGTNNTFRVSVSREGSDNWIRLGSIAGRQGTQALALPDTLSAGLYRTRIESSNPAQVFFGQEIEIRQRPRVLLGGSTTAYAGDEVALAVRITGRSPGTTLTLTDGTRELVYPNLFSGVRVSPLQTTTYRVVRTSNECGTGQGGGQATVTVLPLTASMIRTTAVNGASCSGQRVQVQFSASGEFGPTNQWAVQLSDTSGANFRAIPSTFDQNLLFATLPSDLLPGDRYRIRVIATQPAVEGAALPLPLTLSRPATGVLAGTAAIFKGDTARLTLTFGGEAPWRYALGTDQGVQEGTADRSPWIVRVRPETTTTYRLVSVRNNACGLGTASGTATITVNLITATNPTPAPGLPLQVTVYPNPTPDRVRVEGHLPKPQTAQIRLFDLSGRELMQKGTGPIDAVREEIDLSQHPAGFYLLTVESAGQRLVFRVMKK